MDFYITGLSSETSSVQYVGLVLPKDQEHFHYVGISQNSLLWNFPVLGRPHCIVVQKDLQGFFLRTAVIGGGGGGEAAGSSPMKGKNRPIVGKVPVTR